MDWKLELIVVPVTDVDRAKAFYTEQTDFNCDVDHRAGEDFRVVQLSPPWLELLDRADAQPGKGRNSRGPAPRRHRHRGRPSGIGRTRHRCQ